MTRFGRRTPNVAGLARRRICWLAAASCAVGTLVVAYCSRQGASVGLLAAGVVLMAVGFSVLTVAWGSRIALCDTAMIEFSVPVSFVAARLIYGLVVLVPWDWWFCVVALLPLVSAAFLGRELTPHFGAGETAAAGVSGGSAPDRPLWKTRGVVAATLVLLVFRAAYGVLRVLVPPSNASGWWGFFLFFALPAAVFGVFAVVALMAARSVSSSLVSRWTLPIVLLGFAFLGVGEGWADQWAVLMNSLSSILLQAFFWILLAKAAHRRPGSGPFFFCCYLVGLCWGMAVGVAGALLLVAFAGEAALPQVVPFVVCLLVALVMAFDGRARFFGVEEPSRSAAAVGAGAAGACDGRGGLARGAGGLGAADGPVDLIHAALGDQAHRMAERYRLSPREEEIIAYLLAGRNRPYIRDTLFISLNTVNTHIRNAFAKMDVHSQQELLDVARAEFPVRR